MRLWVKFFIAVGLLFVLVGLFLYFYPAKVVGEAIGEARQATKQEVEAELDSRMKAEQQLVSRMLLGLKSRLNLGVVQLAQVGAGKYEEQWRAVEGLVAMSTEVDLVELMQAADWSYSIQVEQAPQKIEATLLADGTAWIPDTPAKLAIALPTRMDAMGRLSQLGGVPLTNDGMVPLYLVVDGMRALTPAPELVALLRDPATALQRISGQVPDVQKAQLWLAALQSVVSNLAAASKAAQEGNMMELTAQIRRSLDHRTELSRLAEVASLKQLWGGWNSPYGPLGQATDQVTAAQQWTPDPRLHGHALTGALMGGMDWVLQPLNGRQRIEATDGIALLMAGGSGWYLPRAGVIWAGRPAGLPTASPEATRLSWEPELVLVARDGQQRSYLVNSMARGKESRVLVGVGVDELLQELATLGNCIAAVQLDNQWVAAAQPHGKLANLFLLPPLSLAGQAGSVNARIGENEDAYRYSSFPLTQQGKAQLVILRSEKALFAPVLHLQDLLQGLVAQVRRHLLAAHAVALLVVLCLVWIVTRRMTRPLTLLARATRPLMEGHYEEVILPVYHGRDEIGELIGEFEVMRSGLREKAKVQDVLNKVVSPEVAAQIMKTGVALGGEERKVTILFADIRNFTGMSDKLTPVQTVELLNGCMTRVARAIERHNGVIDKFVGDEVMAIYNAPLSHPDPAAAAIASGLEIVEEMRLWNVERETQGLPPVQMGVGIHTGVVVAGNMGAQDRLNYTVIGSNVNLAARLCSYAKGMQVVISDATWSGEGVAQQFVTEKLPPATLKGIPNPVPLFLVTGKR